MLANRISPTLQRLCLFVLVLQYVSPCHAQLERQSDRHPFEGFTQPYRSIDVAVSEAGRVAAVRIKRGDVVKADQLLLQLDSSILEASRQIAEADANSTARIKALTVEHQVQQRRLEQIAALTQTGRSSTEEQMRAEADERVAAFNLQAAAEDQQRKHLALAEIEARIAARSVRSPIDGIVTDVVKDVGEFVSGVEPEVATIVDLTRLRASFFLPTSEAMRLQSGQVLRLMLVETNSRVEGVVEFVGATTAADSGRVRIDVVIDNSKGQNRSGLRCLLDRDSVANPASRTAQQQKAVPR